MSASEWAAWWGAGTGTVSAFLLTARFAWDRNADKRSTRLELRKELRAVAVGAKEECSAARANALAGTPAGPVGGSVRKSGTDGGLHSMAERILGNRKNANKLLIPKNAKLWEAVNDAALALFTAERAWVTLALTEQYPTAHNERQRSVAISEFLRFSDPAVDGCRELIAALDRFES